MVNPNPFAQPITYLLECKRGLVNRMDMDEFFDVLCGARSLVVTHLRGVQLKQGVIGMFAGPSLNPRDRVQMRDGTSISPASYAGRLEIQILRAVSRREDA